MDYRTQFDDHERFICESGREEYEVYTVDDDGNPVVSGVNNRYEEIQSHRESVELSVLLQRYAQGDETALNKVQGVYEDIVDSPKTLADIYEYVKDAENSFNDLPPGLRDLFNNSPVEFWRQAGTPEFLEKFDKFTAAEGFKKKAANSSNNSGSNNDGNSSSGNGGILNE